MKMDLKVYIYRRPNFRSPQWEFQLEIGRSLLEDMFDEKKQLPDVKKATFIFPERHLNIVEQRQLVDYAIPESLPNIEEVEIHTHSVFIIQCAPSGCAFVVNEDVPLEAHEWGDKVCVPYNENDPGLQIFGASVKKDP